MADLQSTRLPSLGREALSGRLEVALAQLQGETGPAACWKRAWLLTALGTYGEALEHCDAAMDGPPTLQSCSLMTRAMLYRQVALHTLAEEADHQALDTMRRAQVRSAVLRAAIRVGQVADAVGLVLDQTVLSRRLRVAAAAVTASGSWRQGVRLTWVRGEVLMLGGSHGGAARSFAEGARVASEQGARRHHAKSLIFLAASRAAEGRRDEAARLAERGLQLAARCGASPLIWPAELILAEVVTEDPERHLARARQFAGWVVDTLPADLRQQALARSPVDWLIGTGSSSD